MHEGGSVFPVELRQGKTDPAQQQEPASDPGHLSSEQLKVFREVGGGEAGHDPLC